MVEEGWISDPVRVRGKGTTLMWLDGLLRLPNAGGHPFALGVRRRLGRFTGDRFL